MWTPEDAKKKAAATYNAASDSYEDWWPMVLGTGYRGTLEQLSTADRERVRLENLEFIGRAEVRSVEANVVYAVAVRT